MIRNLLKEGCVKMLELIAHPAYRVARAIDRVQTGYKTAIIVYHKISDSAEGPDAFWTVQPSLFEQHMAFIAQSDFTVLSLKEFHTLHVKQKRLPIRSVVITFDDGYGSIYQYAYPILKDYGFPATVFLASGYIGNGRNYWWDEQVLREKPDSLKDCRVLSWSEIREMQASNLISFGSHSVSHPHLGSLPQEAIDYELRESKRCIERHLGAVVDHFAYPYGIKAYGDISSETTRLLHTTGYSLACSSTIGRNGLQDDLYALKRIGVSRHDSVAVFKAKLTGAFDWLEIGQRVFQRVFANPC